MCMCIRFMRMLITNASPVQRIYCKGNWPKRPVFGSRDLHWPIIGQCSLWPGHWTTGSVYSLITPAWPAQLRFRVKQRKGTRVGVPKWGVVKFDRVQDPVLINDEFITLLLLKFQTFPTSLCAASLSVEGPFNVNTSLGRALFLCWWALKLPRSKTPPYMSRYPVTLSLTNQRPVSRSRDLYWPMRGHTWHIGHGHTSPRLITRQCYRGGGSGEALTSAPQLRDLDFCNQV